jgi:2-dehydro-3-deoxyphosphogluconate aldolase/(4S)-4-hydroxy-2-oxoglutarate aldolase
MGPGLRVGAGTALGPEDAQRAMDAGAEFLVTPTVQPDTVAACRARGVPILCGAMTPTECLAAHHAGADFVKLFPADGLGPGYVRALRGPLPFLKIMPTGGVSLETLPAFIQAGCAGVALGGNLVSRPVLQTGDWGGLTRTARQYVEALAAARQGRTA